MRLAAVLLVLELTPLALFAQESGAGVVRFPNSGTEEAQASFLYGLAQLHNFEYDPAATAFRKAQQIDPDIVMAYWGEPMTHNHAIWMQQNRKAALAVLKRLGPTSAARLAKTHTEREKDYLLTLDVLYGDGSKL